MMTDIKSAWNEFSDTHPEIAAERNRLIRKMLIKVIIWELVIGIMIVAAYFIAKDHFLSLLAVGLVGAVILPWVTVKPQRLMKKKYTGHITDIQYIQKRISVDSGPSDRYTSMTDSTFICCTVKDARGKCYAFELPDKYAMVYHEGDLILSMSGFAFPINMTEHEKMICPCCGEIAPRENGTCKNCIG